MPVAMLFFFFSLVKLLKNVSFAGIFQEFSLHVRWSWFWGTLLNDCFLVVAKAQTENVVLKFVLRKAGCFFFLLVCLFALFCVLYFLLHFVFVLFLLFWRYLSRTTFHFDFFRLGIARLMLKTIFDALVLITFNCKTQNSLYILMECFKFCYNILIRLIALKWK